MATLATADMGVSIFGIGYVGAVTSACISKSGFPVTAVDINPEKVDRLGRGESPIVEPGLPELLKDGIDSGSLRATTDVRQAGMSTDMSIICVGTPSLPNGTLDLSHIAGVAEQLGEAIGEKNSHHSVVMRSTMLPEIGRASCRERVCQYV